MVFWGGGHNGGHNGLLGCLIKTSVKFDSNN